ncbi:hypothetical protein HFV02_08345 [Acidithiobacillus caldus]|uniref:hypothetical protein n=1 Tax=Acidithiobacillus caldus TaxID=33059 RepID=UPI001C07E7B1|nr:hypothetical protein [Acidithiobacillus caldus]MBU2802265.1 hypothetical protein [Acidithiobacillus caldus]
MEMRFVVTGLEETPLEKLDRLISDALPRQLALAKDFVTFHPNVFQFQEIVEDSNGSKDLLIKGEIAGHAFEALFEELGIYLMIRKGETCRSLALRYMTEDTAQLLHEWALQS